MCFNARIPGHGTCPGDLEMSFRYVDSFTATPPSGYETLIHVCMTADATLLKRAGNTVTCRDLVEPVVVVRSALPARDYPNYAADCRGAAVVEQQLEPEGGVCQTCTGRS